MDIKGKVHRIRDDLGEPFEPKGQSLSTMISNDYETENKLDLPCLRESFDDELQRLETLLKRHAEFDSWDGESSSP